MEGEAKVGEEQRNSVKAALDAGEIELIFGQHLASHLATKQDELAHRMTRMRQKFARQYGFVVPDVRLGEDYDTAPKGYSIRIHGTSVAEHEMRPGDILALIDDAPMPTIPGDETIEPAFGIRALSTSATFSEDLRQMGFKVVDEVSVILTHLSETIRTNLPQLLSFRDVKTLIAGLDTDYRKLADEICTGPLSYPGVQAVLRGLLAEGVSIRNLPLIIEALAEVAPHINRTERLVEHVRMRIAQQLCGDLAVGGRLGVLRLGEEWDKAFHDAVARDASGDVIGFTMEPARLEEFGRAAQKSVDGHLAEGRDFVLVTSPDARGTVRMIMERLHPEIAVLSHVEIARGIPVDVIGQIA